MCIRDRGKIVIVQTQQQVAQKGNGDWFMVQVIWFEGRARDPRVNTMFQIANVDNAEIAWVEGDAITHVIP